MLFMQKGMYLYHTKETLKADKLIYDRLNKKISANGNIALMFGDLVFQASNLEYSFISKRGFLSNVKGSFNSYTLIDDLSSISPYLILKDRKFT